MSSEKVKRFIQEMRAVEGALYGWWRPLANATHLPYGEPMYTRADAEHTPAYVKKNDVNCTGLVNQALGRMGVAIPKDPSGNWWRGGTAAWCRAVQKRRPVTAAEIERGVPVGTAIVGDYVDGHHQGHIAVVSTPKKNGRQMCIQSDDVDPGPGTPGVTEKRTLKETVELTRSVSKGGVAYFGEVPGIGVMGARDADEIPDEGSEEDRERRGTFTVVDLREAMPNLPLQRAQDYFPHLVAAMREARITTRVRVCHFLAQLGHESVDLLHMEEIGDRQYFMRYENRRDLGNVRPGDGPRYHGRGPIQLTGRANYRAAGRDLGLDLERNPERAADPKVAFRIAGWYWTSRNLNKFADLGDAGVDDVTKLINGGYNGLDDRRKRYFNCKRVLPERFSLGGGGDLGGGEGGEMSFQKVILAHATHAEGVLAHEAAAVLHRHGVKCTVADAANMKAAIAACQDEDVGAFEFVVIGEPAKDMFPDGLKKYIGESVKRSDYRDAVGDDLEETADKLARVLDGIGDRKDVSGDLRAEFEESLRIVDLTPQGNGGRRSPDDDDVDRGGRGGPRDRGGSNGKRNGSGDEGPRFGDLTEEDYEEIGREAFEFFSTIRKLTGQR